jgi:hypothetical protein
MEKEGEMDANRRFAKLAGLPYFTIEHIDGEWVCGCGFKVLWEDGKMAIQHLRSHNSPDYAADPRLVLEVMLSRKDGPLFMARLMYGFEQPGVEAIDWDNNIDVDYILDTTGKLRDLAIEWMEKEAMNV